jgi:hypothetical protein
MLARTGLGVKARLTCPFANVNPSAGANTN